MDMLKNAVSSSLSFSFANTGKDKMILLDRMHGCCSFEVYDKITHNVFMVIRHDVIAFVEGFVARKCKYHLLFDEHE